MMFNISWLEPLALKHIKISSFERAPESPCVESITLKWNALIDIHFYKSQKCFAILLDLPTPQTCIFDLESRIKLTKFSI